MNVDQDRMLTFEVGSSLFAISIEAVHEVAEMGVLACVPTLPVEVAGVVNYRGDALPVVRRERLLTPGDGALEQPEHVLVIGERPGAPPSLGLTADRVLGPGGRRAAEGQRLRSGHRATPPGGAHGTGSGCVAPDCARARGDRRIARSGERSTGVGCRWRES